MEEEEEEKKERKEHPSRFNYVIRLSDLLEIISSLLLPIVLFFS